MVSASAALTSSYNYGEVARSVLIAIAASYAALDLAGRVTAARGRIRLAWLSGGAIAMGIGIWAMHFKGMLAFHLPVPVEYHWPTVLSSVVVAIFASAFALYVSSRRKMGLVEALAGSIIMGAAIAGMHYIGMAAMRLPAITRYSPLLVACSILLAIFFSLIALLMAFDLREETRWSVPRRLGSATLMGAAVSAMHYTGMAAARFFPASSPDLSHAVTISSLGNNGIVIVTLIVIVAAMTTSSVDRRRNEEHLRLVIDTTPAMIHSARPDGYLDFFNERWLEYLGVSLDDLLGWRWTSVIHSDDLARLVDRWQTALATGKPFEAEARLRRADGEYRLTLHRKVPLRDETGTIVKWYGSVIDIEDRKRAEDELQRQKEVFQKIFEHIPVMIAFFDANGQIGMVNPEWERTLGWTLKEIRERNLDIFAELYPDPRYRQMVREYLGSPSGARREFEVRVRDGSVIDMVARVVQLSDGSTLGIGRDITEQKRAEQAQLRLAAIVASSDDAIISKDMNGIIMSWNDAAERIFGYTRTEAVGQPITIIIPPELSNEEREILRRLRNGEHIQHYETIRVTKQGNKVNVSLTISPMRNSEGQVVGASKIARDITEHLRAEHALQEAQSELARVTRVAAMGELAAAIAHEVNQPLGAVVTNGSASLRWLAGQPPNLEEVREAIERTVREANRASDVIRRIRALLQKGPPQMERLDVNLVILEVLTLSGSEILRGGVVVRTELADVPAVLGDRVQLQQVILNLILNSIDAMSTITDRPRELLVKSSRHPNGVLIQVHDSGEGVDPKQADHIFEAFFTTKPQGIGMGLSIGRSIIEAHGGRLWFTPGSSHGVVFQFTVPKADTSDERAA